MDTLHRDEVDAILAESARAVFAAGSSSNVPEDEWGAGLIKRLGGLEMSMEGLDAEWQRPTAHRHERKCLSVTRQDNLHLEDPKKSQCPPGAAAPPGARSAPRSRPARPAYDALP